MEIELRHLRSFVAVAEELNFTRAAERLFIAQQALSAQIRQLEERVGAQLLHRTTRSVELTPAGAELYTRASVLLDGAADAIAATRSAAATTSTATVGFVAAIDHPMVALSLEDFSQAHPEVSLLVHFGDLLDPTGGLRAKDVDVAFVYGPFDTRGLVLDPLFAVPMGVACAASHEFAKRESVSIADVVAEPTFDFPAPDREWREYWGAVPHRGGRAPSVTAQFRTLEGLLAALRAGLGVSLATQSLVDASPTGVMWRPIVDHPPLQHSIARRSGDERPVVMALWEAVRQHFAAADPAVAPRR